MIPPERPASKDIQRGSANTSSFSISARISVAASVVIWQPAGPYTLYPLYFAGLWEAVIITPAAHPSARTAQERHGVGISRG